MKEKLVDDCNWLGPGRGRVHDDGSQRSHAWCQTALSAAASISRHIDFLWRAHDQLRNIRFLEGMSGHDSNM
jgi:hypothetical protein